MAVCRIEKNDNYTVMSNVHLKDKNLSLKAIGLLSKVLSLPNGWDYTIKGLCSICKEEERAITSALKELKENGYLKVNKIKPIKDNNFFSYEYIFYENPVTTVPLQDVPLQDVPLQDVPLQDVPLNKVTKQPNTKKLNKEEILNPLFDDFYSCYPRKVDKANAKKAFIKLNPTEELVEKMKKSAILQYGKVERKDIKFIPYPSTWINGRRWNDELAIITDDRKISPDYGSKPKEDIGSF